ncbi:Serine/threonine protein kinase [Malassezia pachydermatis]
MVPAMQHSYTRPAYVGKRIVAIKQMKRTYTSWQEGIHVTELHALLSIPLHDHIVTLYDVFVNSLSNELFIVFECMEGNLLQLLKSRKGQSMAPGLVASISKQVLSGLDHVHAHGFFHRDMKPENILITTIGLGEYPVTQGMQATTSQDVLVLAKIADFGLAKRIESEPPYTEYVSTRWYRAPEILLRDKIYSAPVDIWALGTILAEMINLNPLFPGTNDMDQLLCIFRVLGTPSRTSSPTEERHALRGGGAWPKAFELAATLQIELPSFVPVQFSSLFPPFISPHLIDLVFSMLRYEPQSRLTTRQCLEHHYIMNEARLLRPYSCMLPDPSPPLPENTALGPPISLAAVEMDGRALEEPQTVIQRVQSPVPVMEKSPSFSEKAADLPYDNYGSAQSSSASTAHDESPQSHSIAKLHLLNMSLSPPRPSMSRRLMHSLRMHQTSTPPPPPPPQDAFETASLPSPLANDNRPCSEGYMPPYEFQNDTTSVPLSAGSGGGFLGLRKKQKDPTAKEAKQAERQRRKDEVIAMRERSRAVIQKRVDIMNKDHVSKAPVGWVDYSV